ncbi:hypothetical protein CHISP_0881 [Chitinispirillum alkaliphilum]|nr:hypothetical protein CHISP_0881 [Chitinispirillum alkaliphilum]
MMQIPRNYRKQKMTEIKCAVPGCEEVFYGIKSAKYCAFHKNPQNREKKKVEHKDISEENLIFEHENSEIAHVVFKCSLDRCDQEYDVKVYPRQFVYPKYCPEHRNEHKRKQFLKRFENRNCAG